MTSARPSAVDCVSPAVDRAKWLLLNPFRWPVWWRMTVVALGITGQGAVNIVRIPNIIDAGRQSKNELIAAGLGDIFSQPRIAWLIALLVVLILILVVIHLYVSSVLRFILFDAVCTGRYRLRAGWKMWNGRGTGLFLLQLAVALFMLVLALGIGIPLGLASYAGLFPSGKEHVGLIVGGVLLLLPLLFAFVVAMYVLMSFIFDFTVPIMAIEDAPGGKALRRVWQMFKSAKAEFAGFLGMKFVLSLMIGICIAIVEFIVLMMVLVPVFAAVVGVSVASPGIWSSPAAIATMVTLGSIAFLVLTLIFGLFAVPLTVFIQSYAVTFFAARYEPLWQLLYPTAPLAPAPAPTGVVPGEPPPLPAL